MTKEEYKIINKFLDKLIKELKTEMKSMNNCMNDEAVKGSQRYTIAYLKVWKELIKEDYEQLK